jgi:hypothetical protein
MSEYTPTEKGTPIRQPSIANLMVDSADRPTVAGTGWATGQTLNVGTPFDFTIQRNNALMNGYFTRIGLTEMVLEWNIPNVCAPLSNQDLNWYVPASNSFYSTSILVGNYSVSSLAAQIAAQMTARQGSTSYSVSTLGAGATYESQSAAIVNNTNAFLFSTPTVLAQDMFIPALASTPLTIQPLANNIDLRPFRYLDFVCTDLTYNQAVKDTATSKSSVDTVITRWYFDWDSPTTYDALGYPIHQGYFSFNERRLFNPPKQIRWAPNMPIGNLRFVTYDPNGQNISNYLTTNTTNGGQGLIASAPTNFLMTLQASEV